MKLIILSLKLFLYGLFCDACVAICTFMAERRIKNGRSLNKKLLIFMSNLSERNLNKWRSAELDFIRFSLFE